MYLLKKLTPQSIGNYNELISHGVTRTKEMSIVIAKLLSDQLPLPASKVDDIQSYYNLIHRFAIESQLYQINELMILDTAYIASLTQKFYELRYSFVHPSQSLSCINSNNAVLDFFSILKVLDENTLSVIAKNGIRITDLYNKMKNIIAELARPHSDQARDASVRV